MTAPAYLQEFADRAPSLLGSGFHISITVRHGGVNVRAATSDHGAARCDQAEALADDGPCILALKQLQATLIPDLATEDRWRSWCDQAVAEGYASMVAMPAVVREDTAVSLNIYSERPDPWDAEMLAAADSYAQLIAAILRLRLEGVGVDQVDSAVYGMLDDERIVENALAAVMRLNSCTEEQARGILASASGHRNVSHRQVAETILSALTGGDSTDADAGSLGMR